MNITYKGQSLEVTEKTDGTIWDAVQTTPFVLSSGKEAGRGSFQIGELTIFASNLAIAKMIARRL